MATPTTSMTLAEKNHFALQRAHAHSESAQMRASRGCFLSTLSSVISSIVLLVFASLTMTGVVSPLIGASVVIGVTALSGLVESVILAKALGKFSILPIIMKIATTSIYLVISSLAITNLLSAHTFGVAIIPPTLLVGVLAIGGFCRAISLQKNNHTISEN